MLQVRGDLVSGWGRSEQEIAQDITVATGSCLTHSCWIRRGGGGGESALDSCADQCFRTFGGLSGGERGGWEGAGSVVSFGIGGGLVNIGEEGNMEDPTQKLGGGADEGGGADAVCVPDS